MRRFPCRQGLHQLPCAGHRERQDQPVRLGEAERALDSRARRTLVTQLAAGERVQKMGITDPRTIYGIEDMARGDCLFAATGVTTGSLLSGVKFRKDSVIETETVVMRSVTGTVRTIKAEHRQLEKFHLD